MTDYTSRKRVLLIGAGFRAANNFLPSFSLLPDEFEISGILARSMVRSVPLSDLWKVPVFSSLAEVDPRGIDVVAVTVPTNQNFSVLEAILRWNHDVLLVIDTPVAWNYLEYRTLAPLLRRFPAVVVAEDFMNFPQFELARRAVQEGLLGRVLSVTLFNTGYAHHGLALLRSFTDLAQIVSSSRVRLGSYTSVMKYRFAGGMRGYVVGPYRQNVTGGIVVEGERAVITQAAEDAHFADVGKRSFYRLAPVMSDERPKAFVLENTSLRINTTEIASMSDMPFDDKSQLNVFKNFGLKTIFRSLIMPDKLNSSYGFENALYDSFASRLASKGLFPFDPFVALAGGFMSLPRLATGTFPMRSVSTG